MQLNRLGNCTSVVSAIWPVCECKYSRMVRKSGSQLDDSINILICGADEGKEGGGADGVIRFVMSFNWLTDLVMAQ